MHTKTQSNKQEKISTCPKTNKETLCTKAKNPDQNLHIAHPGPVPPMAAVEANLLDVMLQLATMRAPVTPKIGLEIANSMVKGTATEAQIVEWKRKHVVTCNDDDDPVKLGQNYWQFFL